MRIYSILAQWWAGHNDEIRGLCNKAVDVAASLSVDYIPYTGKCLHLFTSKTPVTGITSAIYVGCRIIISICASRLASKGRFSRHSRTGAGQFRHPSQQVLFCFERCTVTFPYLTVLPSLQDASGCFLLSFGYTY